MRRERYFQDELRRLFLGYAVVPAIVFTLVCGLIFLAALLYGKYSLTDRQNAYVASELERVIEGFSQGLAELEAVPGISELAGGEGADRETKEAAERRKRIYEVVYRLENEIGYAADFQVMRREPDRPSWGLSAAMEREPGQVVVQLLDGWKNGDSVLAVGKMGKGAYGLSFTLDRSRMQPMIDNLDTQTIVSDPFGWVYLGGAHQFLTENNQVKQSLENAGHFLVEDGQLYLAAHRSVGAGGFHVYSVSNIQNIVASLAISGMLVVTALVVMAVWLVMASKRVTARKTEDFYRILDALKQVKSGDLDVTITLEHENEFRIIADACNEMMDGLKTQLENNQKMAELVAAAQNKQLESQFNPHFLYNTLENIRYMCKLDPSAAERMVFNLSSLLRYSLNGGEAEVSLREDLAHLEHYLAILKYRFGERFQCRTEVAQELLDEKIPRLLFQPMIENAVKYGFGRQACLQVELKVYRHEGRLIMICRDDGAGMSQQTQDELRKLFAQKENTSRHSGLYNIHRRITLLYGAPYGVEIRSAEGHGTTLVVTIPARKEE